MMPVVTSSARNLSVFRRLSDTPHNWLGGPQHPVPQELIVTPTARYFAPRAGPREFDSVQRFKFSIPAISAYVNSFPLAFCRQMPCWKEKRGVPQPHCNGATVRRGSRNRSCRRNAGADRNRVGRQRDVGQRTSSCCSSSSSSPTAARPLASGRKGSCSWPCSWTQSL